MCSYMIGGEKILQLGVSRSIDIDLQLTVTMMKASEKLSKQQLAVKEEEMPLKQVNFVILDSQDRNTHLLVKNGFQLMS